MKELIVGGQQTMSSLEIAQITCKKHAHVMRDIRRMLEKGVSKSNFGLSEYTDNTGRTLPCYELTKKGTLLLVSGYNTLLREAIINRWEELENNASVTTNTIPTTWTTEKANVFTILVESSKKILNLSDVSVAQMYNKAYSENGMPLIDYVPAQDVVHSITYLLKEHNISMTAKEFNKLAEEKGILMHKSRPTHKGTKYFWCINDDYLTYGRNDVSPQNPKETQPSWYDNKFTDLINILKA